MKKLMILIISIVLIGVCYAGHPEKWYQLKWCDERGGRVEVIMPDKTRCDCLTATHAIEFDFGKKWAESLGQSLNYGRQTGKRAGIVLIIKGKKEMKYAQHLEAIIAHYNLPVDLWTVDK